MTDKRPTCSLAILIFFIIFILIVFEQFEYRLIRYFKGIIYPNEKQAGIY